MEQYVYMLMCRDVDEIVMKAFSTEEDALATLESERKYYVNEPDCYVVGEENGLGFSVYHVDEEERQTLTYGELLDRDEIMWWVEPVTFFTTALRVGLNVKGDD